MNSLRYLYIVILFIFLSGGCDKKPEAPTKLVVILYDISGSTAQQPVRTAYLENSRPIFSRINHGDALYAALISHRSLAQLMFLVSYSAPPFVPKTDNPLYREAEKKKADLDLQAKKDSLLEVVRSVLFDTTIIPRTEIMDALQVAARVFRSVPRQKNVLVVMSDMIEDSRQYNFDREKLTPGRITEIIHNEQDAQRLPDLRDVKVYIVGATANTQRYYQIRDFWSQYFAACGATLVDYGAALVDFKE
jgi:hypothetical protein